MRISNISVQPPANGHVAMQVGLIDAQSQSVFVNISIAEHSLETVSLGELRKLAMQKAAAVLHEASHGG